MTMGQSRPGISWLWLLVLFTVAGFIEAAFYGQVSAFTPLYLPHLGIPQWVLAFTYIPLVITALYHGSEPGKAVGMVVAVGGLATLVLSPVIGTLADHFGHWKVLFIGAMTQVALWPLPALAPNLLSFTIAWALINRVTSAVFAISFTVLSDAASSEVRGRVMSFAYLPVNVGSIVGPTIGSLVTRVSVFSVFPVAAVLTALGIGALFIASRLSP